jgi:hypothetical protein
MRLTIEVEDLEIIVDKNLCTRVNLFELLDPKRMMDYNEAEQTTIATE